jgi:hypothetical protein
MVLSFNNINIEFNTDNFCEIIEMTKYFSKFWMISSKCEDVYWNVYSFRNKLKIIDKLRKYKFVKKSSAMHDLRDAYVYNYKGYFYLTIDFSWVIFFNRDKHQTILYKSDDVVHTILLSQLIKDPIFSKLKMNGYVALHCSACSYNGKGIILAANKNAGKSTLLLHLLELGAYYIGNDSALIKEIDNKIEILAYPHMARFGIETCRDFNKLNQFVYRPEKIPIETRGNYFMSSGMTANGKIQLFMEALLDLFSTEYTLNADLNYILFPKMNTTNNKVIITKLEKNETISMLYSSTFNRDQKVQWLPYFEDDLVNDKEITSFHLLQNLLSNSYLIEFGNYIDGNPQKQLYQLLVNQFVK